MLFSDTLQFILNIHWFTLLLQLVQPMAEDLHWVQIEDFVEVFNRVYIATDCTILQQ